MSETIRPNFLTDIIDADLAAGRHDHVVTRFPPEPNGYLHIGHAKSIFLNYGTAQRYKGRFNVRFDDTNPEAEKTEYVQGILRDVQWLLGLDELERVFWASDYFQQMHDFAVELIEKGLAYVDDQTPEEVRATRGDFNTPGTNSPWRDRSVEENLELFRLMRAGEFADGTRTLRAKIDMGHPNMVMRDPLLYRIKHATHHNTGDEWCIYPMYDFAHCLEDSIEHITHSFCTLEFDNNRELYDWVLDNVTAPSRPHQYEFARLNLEHTVMSKRRLRRLVEEGHVSGWDDPRMPTVVGLRRRGVRPEALRKFADLIGVAKTNSTVDYGKLEYAIRDDLNAIAPRTFALLEPVPLVLTNVPAGEERLIEAPLFPDDPDSPTRTLRFGRELLVEASDFDAAPPAGWKRLSPDAVVRLRYAGLIRCDNYRSVNGVVQSIEATLLDESDQEGVGVIHWLSAQDSHEAEVRLYDRLFSVASPEADSSTDFIEHMNPDSLVVLHRARVEPWLHQEGIRSAPAAGEAPTLRVQLERTGYFAADSDTSAERLVLNRIVTLKDAWEKQQRGTDEDMETLRARKEAERAAQAARSASARKSAAELAQERGTEVVAAFESLKTAGLEESDALAIASAGPEIVAFVQASGAPADAAPTLGSISVNLLLPAWAESGPGYPAAALGQLVQAVASGVLSGADAKRAHALMVENGQFDAAALSQCTGEALQAIVDAVIADHPDEVARYREGRTQLLGFFLGQVMRRADGADAAEVRKRLGQSL